MNPMYAFLLPVIEEGAREGSVQVKALIF